MNDKEKQVVIAALEHLRQTKLAFKNQPDQKPVNRFDLLDSGHTQAVCLSLMSKIGGQPIAYYLMKV